MEAALYSKLYDTYMKLKSKKWSELDNVNKDQEVKFMDYISAAEQVIQQLKSENERLLSQVKDLTSEVASIRSAKDEQCIEYQELLMEENRKNEELSEEVARLRNLQQVGNFSRLKDSKTDNGGVCAPASGQVSEEAGNRSQRRKTHKRRRPIERKAAKAKRGRNSSSNTSKFLEEIARQSAMRIEIDLKTQEDERAIQVEYAKEREYVCKENIEKKDRETMAMDTSHMSPETKQFWKLERRDVMRRRLFRDDGPSNTDWLNDQNH
ncbi:hypothetical protein CerSpe_163370 [Prunus speciosa]